MEWNGALRIISCACGVIQNKVKMGQIKEHDLKYHENTTVFPIALQIST